MGAAEVGHQMPERKLVEVAVPAVVVQGMVITLAALETHHRHLHLKEITVGQV